MASRTPKVPSRTSAKRAPASSSRSAGSRRSTGGKRAPSGATTRTSSRSAKRRSPKEPAPDTELLELERTQFLRAMDSYKRKTGKTFPTWTEVLDVLRDLGWVSPAKLESDRERAGA